MLAGFTLHLNTPCERNARNDRFDRRLTLWPSAIAYCRSSKGFCSIPSGFRKTEANAAKTSFLQAVKRPLTETRDKREGHALARACISGALPAWPTCRTGGNQSDSDHPDSTAQEVILQAWIYERKIIIALFFNYLQRLDIGAPISSARNIRAAKMRTFLSQNRLVFDTFGLMRTGELKI